MASNDSETGRVKRDASDLPPNPEDIDVKVGVRAAHLKYIFSKVSHPNTQDATPCLINPFSAGTVFMRQNLTSVDVRF